MFIVFVTGIATLALFVGIAWHLAPLYPGIVVLELAFTPRSFGTVVHAWPPEYLQLYRSFLPVDLLLLASYGAFGYLFVSRSRLFRERSTTPRTATAWALPLAATLGAVENALHTWLTAAPRFGIPWVYALSATCAASKWVISVGFILAVIQALLHDEV